MNMIDLRSDTVTRPAGDMLKAMMNARVGDDVYGEDPSINELQEYAAELFGMEAALFCPSGTMTNQIAIKAHTRHGDEVICHETAHIYNYEGGGIAATSGVMPRLITSDDGTFTAADAERLIQPNDPHAARTSLVSIENTCNKPGGTVWDLDKIDEIAELCKKRGLKLHLDGARLFNALVKTGKKPRDFGARFDSISICLSKGLGAPGGSLLLGSGEFIAGAHRIRKRLGGGMRQAGYFGAAGLYALKNHVDRLEEDHLRAEKIAAALADNPAIKRVEKPVTNIVLFETENVSDQLKKLEKKGIKAGPMGAHTIRFVTHLDLTDADVDRVCKTVREEW